MAAMAIITIAVRSTRRRGESHDLHCLQYISIPCLYWTGSGLGLSDKAVTLG